MGQTISSKSATVNSAAKDDTLVSYTFTKEDLLANDPGGALKNMDTMIIDDPNVVDNGDGTYTYSGPADGTFSYSVQMASGTWSTAEVSFDVPCDPHAGDQLFFDNFSSYTTAQLWGTADLSSGGWTSTGSATEVVADGYQGVLTGDSITGGTYWLDSAGSPGGIDIETSVNDANGGQAQIVLNVATQQFGTYTTDPNTELDIIWNGVTVGSITASDFDAANAFEDFSFVVDSNTGSNSLQIVDTNTNSYVGFAIDSVQVNDWLIC